MVRPSAGLRYGEHFAHRKSVVMLQHPANGVDVIFAVALIFKVSGTGYIGEFKEASIVVLYVSCPGGEVTGATGQRGVAVLGKYRLKAR